MGLTKFKKLLSFRNSKNHGNPRRPAYGHRGRDEKTASEAKVAPSDERSCLIPEDSQHRVPVPRSAPNGNQEFQACPPEKPSRGSSPTLKDSNTPIHELWAVAFEKLRAEDEDLVADYEKHLCGDLSAALSSTLGSKVATQDRMQTILEHKIDEVSGNAWKLKFGSSEVQVEDLVKPVLSVVDRANDYITNALSANTCASLAWGAVSLLLPLLLNPSEQAASMAKGLEYISSLIVQSRLWENLYFRRYESNAGQHVSLQLPHMMYKNALETLYRQILRFQITSYCYYAKQDAFRLSRDMVKWDDWDGLLGKIKEQERIFSAVSESWRDMKYDEECTATEQRHRDAISCWQTIGKDTSGLLQAVQDAQAEKNHDNFLGWLCSIDPSEMYNSARDQHINGTSDWLVKSSKKFKTWQGSPSSLLWLHGKAGSGKSILSSSVVKHLKDQCASDPRNVLAYFFFSFSDPGKQTVAGMLSSLVKQLYASRPDTPQPVKILKDHKKKGERPDTKTLEAALIATARGFTTVFIIIDALDECPVFKGERKKLLASLSRIIADMPDNLHIFCTSRAEQDIQTAMRTILLQPLRAAIDLTEDQEGLSHDICLYIDSTLEEAAYSSWPVGLKAEAKASMIEKADGMFQYITCQFEALQNLSSIPRIREELRNLPVGLDATYDRLFQNIDKSFQARAKCLLQWLACSEEVLHLRFLAEIFTLHPEHPVVVDEDERLFDTVDVLKYISSLVVTHEPVEESGDTDEDEPDYNPTVRLSHFTIKEYLTSSRIREGPAGHFSFTETDAHLYIAHSCLVYHLHSIYYGDESRWPLMHYALIYWMAHLETVPREAWSSEVECLALRALGVCSESLYTMVRNANRPAMRPPCNGRGLEYLKMARRPQSYTARLGFLRLTEMLLCEGLGRNGYLTQEDLDMALQEAAYKGHTDVVQLLLANGADVNADSPSFGGALHAAAFEGHVSVLELLLDNGADVNGKHSQMRSPLHIVASRHHFDALKLLVERGAHLNLPPDEGGCALVAAVSYGPGCHKWTRPDIIDCLQFMIDNGADIEGKDEAHRTALGKAAQDKRTREHFYVLVERGADVNAGGGVPGYPLQGICSRTWSDSTVADVEMLLDNGADVNAQGGKYGTALQAACDNNDEHIVKLLLQKGADVGHQGGENGNALQAACLWGNGGIIRRLLDEGADINAEGGYFGSALQAAAAEAGSAEAVELLLSKGANINKQGGEYGTALQASSFGGQIDIVRLLIEHGADVNVKGGCYGTALQASSFKGRIDIVRLLIEHGADVNVKGGYYGTALQAACSEARIDIARLLIEHGADVNVEGGYEGTALQAACSEARIDIARLLIEHGADVHVQGGQFGSAWHAAALRLYCVTETGSATEDESTSNALLQLLLDHGVDVNDTKGKQYPDALRATFAAESLDWDSKIERIRFLVDRGADVNLMAGKYGFPLQAAFVTGSRYGYDGEDLLLEYPNVDVNAEGGAFGFALQAAAHMGQTDSVWLLLEEGADPDARGGKYGSAMNAAVIEGFWDIVELLLERGAKPDSQLLPEPDEEWLARVREEHGRGAVERYRLIWDRYKVEQSTQD